MLSIALMTLALAWGCGKGNSNEQLLRSRQRQQTAKNETRSPEELYELAGQRLEFGNTEEAEAIVQKLLIADPEKPEYIILAAECQAAKGQVMEAVATLESVKGADNVMAAALERASNLLADIDRLDLAAAKLERILEMFPESNRIRHRVASLLNNQGRRIATKPHLDYLLRDGDATEKDMFSMSCYADAFTDAGVDLPADSEQQWTMTVLGKAKEHWHVGELRQARSLIERLAINQEEPSPAVFAFLGVVFAEADDDRAMQLWITKVPEGIAAEPEYWRALGIWLQRNGHVEEAVRCFCEAVLIDETDRFAYARLGQCLQSLGYSEAANEAQQRFQLLADIAEVMAGIGVEPGSKEDLEAVAERMVELKRPWEAVGWREVSSRLHGYTDAEKAEIVTAREELAAAEELDNTADDWRTCGIDVDKFPLPAAKLVGVPTTKPLPQQPLYQGTPRAISLQDISKQVGFEFQYNNGDDPDDTTVFLHQLTGGGIGVIDYDLDGRPDVALSQAGGEAYDAAGSEPNGLQRNLAGKAFVDVAALAGIDDRGYGQGVAVADLNQDGFPDLVIANIGPNATYINCGDGTFRRQQTPGTQRGDWTTVVACGDLSGNGLPDVFEVNYVDDPRALSTPCTATETACVPSGYKHAVDQILWNTGDGSFGVKRDELQAAPGPGFAAIIANFDRRDGNDVFVANDVVSNHYWRSVPDAAEANPSALVESAQVSGLANGFADTEHGCMGTAAGDFDRNGMIDLHVTNFWTQPSDLYLQQKGGTFINKTLPYGLYSETRKTVAWGTQAVDFDCDGWLDLAVLNGHVIERSGTPFRMRPQLFRGIAGRFVTDAASEATSTFWEITRHGRTLAVIDWNGDGRQDLIAGHLHSPTLLLENQTDSLNWVQVELVGTESERGAVGAEVVAVVDGKRLTGFVTGGDGFLCSNEAVTGFGIGDAEKIDHIEIKWPSGAEAIITAPEPNRRYLLVEGDDQPWTR